MSSRGRPEEAQAALVQCQGLGAIEAEKQVQEMILASASTSTSAEDEDDSVQAKISEIFDSPYVIIRGLTCKLYVRAMAITLYCCRYIPYLYLYRILQYH